MTDKDLHDIKEEKILDQRAEDEDIEPAEEVWLAEDDIQEQNDESQEDAQDSSSESEEEEQKESAFLSQWQKRHEEYLAGMASSNSSSEQAVEKESESSKKSKAKRFPMDTFSLKRVESEVEEGDETPSLKDKTPIPTLALWKSVPVFLLATMLALLSLYFISPLSKEKNLTVTGNTVLAADDILKSSLIYKRDYALTTYLNREGHASNIKKSSLWLDTVSIDFQFPNKFTIQVTEYRQLAYVKQGGTYYPVLTSGSIMSDMPLKEEKLPEGATIIELRDSALVKKLVVQLATMDAQLMANIETIQLTPSKATADLLTLTMFDGNDILVPLSEIEKKLPYYQKIEKQLTVPSIVDMEVGIFSYAK